MIDIQEINPEHIPEAKAVMTAAFGEKMRQAIEHDFTLINPNHFFHLQFLVAIEDNEIIGTVATLPTGFCFNTRSILWVSVHPRKQKSGVGTLLIKAMIRYIQSKYFTDDSGTILLSSEKHNIPYYKKFGFTACSEMHPPFYLMQLPVEKE